MEKEFENIVLIALIIHTYSVEPCNIQPDIEYHIKNQLCA